jgi:O-antigen ligase
MVVAFAYALALVTVYLLLTRFQYGLYSLAVLIPFIEMLPASPVPGINSVTVLVGLGLVLALTRERVFVPRALSLGPPIIALLVITLVSWAGVVVFGRVPGYDVLENLFTIKRWFTFILLYFIFLRIREPESVWGCLGAIWLGVALEALVAFYQYKTAFTGRLRGTIGGNQNDFGAFLALYMIVGIVLFLQERGKGRKIAIGAGLFLAGFGLVYSLSRGAYLTFVAAMVVFLYFRARRAAFVIGAVVGILVLVGVNLQALFPKAAVERVEATYEGRDMVYVPQLGMEIELSAASRIFYAQAALGMIKKSPIWGVGFGTFVHRVQRYLDPSIYSKRNVAHNMFLQITSEMGLLGLAAFLWIIVRAMRVGRWLYRYADRDTAARTLGVGLIAITVGLMVTNLFGNRFFNGMIVGYYFIIVALATRILMTRQEDVTAKDLEPQGGIDTWSRKPSTLPA